MTPKARFDTASSHYREFAAPPPLASHVVCLWTQTILGSGEYVHRILPDACVDIVLINDSPAVVVGPATVPFLARFQAGTRVFGARLRPALAPDVLGIPASALLNDSAPLSDIWGKKSARLTPLLKPFTTPDARSVLIEVLVRAIASGSTEDTVVGKSVRWLARHPRGRVEDLSQLIGISHRQLRRRFAEAVGYGPKVLQSVLRFQRILNLAGSPGHSMSLAQLAADAGYADQAHMTRAVRRFAHCTPTVLLRSNECTLGMSDLFKTGDCSA